ncbi:MAG: dihydroorotate dehydrogenase [Desulfobacterales bacterium]|nr:dihydroorotate dehydrogenase [Desulfobacterales bacterium]
MAIGQPDLTARIGSLILKNPVLTASGTFGYGEEFAALVNLDRLGAVVVKGISLKARSGNPMPRVVETACGMLNAIGLENVGAERFITEKLPFFQKIRTPLVANILGDSVAEYRTLARRLERESLVAALEVNISCPNVKKGGVAFGIDPDTARAVTEAVRKEFTRPVIVKLSPNVTDITVIARAVEAGGADAVSLINTLLGMAIDGETRQPRLANIVGGLSGPAIKPVALRMVWQVARAVRIPVIGIGGITTAADAVEFLLAGATAVQVGTANFFSPRASEEVVDGLAAYLRKQGLESVGELIGGLIL